MIWLIIAGLCAGVISGMGIGGGTILIPALTLLLGLPQKTAQAINLLYFIPTASVALWQHHKSKRIEKKLLMGLILGGLLGALAGAILANWISGEYLGKGFGIFLTIIGVMEVFKKPMKKEGNKTQKDKDGK